MTIKELFHLRRMDWEPVGGLGRGMDSTDFRIGRSHAGEKILEEKNGNQTWIHWIKDGKLDETVKFVNGEEVAPVVPKSFSLYEKYVKFPSPLTNELKKMVHEEEKDNSVKKSHIYAGETLLKAVGIRTNFTVDTKTVRKKFSYSADKQQDIFSVPKAVMVATHCGLYYEYEKVTVKIELDSDHVYIEEKNKIQALIELAKEA